MSSLEFPDILYPEYLVYGNQSHEILLDQWPISTMDLTFDKNFVMQKLALSHQTSILRATAPPFTYSLASRNAAHMNQYTLSTKSKTNATRLIEKNNHLIYVTRKSQLNVQFLPNNTYDDLWSNTVNHLSTTKQRTDIFQSPTSIKLLDCAEDDQLLNIALADRKGVSFYHYDPDARTFTFDTHIQTPDKASIQCLSLNPYISSNAIFIDKNYRTHLLDDGTITYLHWQTDEKLHSDIHRQMFLDWDASPFLYTIADNHHGSCLLYDTRLRNESFKELFVIGNNHPYLDKTEILRNHKRSTVNSYQHIFVTDYSVIIIDSRMPNRAAIHSHHELLRPPTSFTQIQSNDRHVILINDEYNTNVLEYNFDSYRRLIQRSPCWELCPISNSRMYLINNDDPTMKELLFGKSIHFDVPIRDIAAVLNPINAGSFLLFQLNSAGNIHVQLFDESVDKAEEKTWNPNPDDLLIQPPDCFRKANDFWSTKLLPLFQCHNCLTTNIEPTNFTVVTPLTAMMQTSLRDFPTFKNDHETTEKIIPAELLECPTCMCMPTLKTKGQLSRAQNWIQDWKAQLENIQIDPIEVTSSATTQNWREIFDYDELNESNQNSELWNEIHRPWCLTDSNIKEAPVKSSLE